MSIGNIEDASVFSHLFHSDFNPDETKKYLSVDLEKKLINKGYLAGILGEIASRLTLKSQVAASMIVAEVDEDAIGGYLVEPFADKEVLPDLYAIYLKNRQLS